MAASRVTILIVDDDTGHIALVRRHLRRAGIDNPIDTVNSGQDALDYVARTCVHEQSTSDAGLLVLLDINMPGEIDGIEVLRRLKSEAATQLIPVVMLTTADDPREVDRCYALGCNVYVTKPVDPSAFMVAIRRLGQFLSVMSVPKYGLRLT